MTPLRKRKQQSSVFVKDPSFFHSFRFNDSFEEEKTAPMFYVFFPSFLVLRK